MLNSAWSVLCVVGVWGFVAAVVGLVLTSFPARGVFLSRPALRWGAAALAFFVLWLIGMSHA
ncbi:hypothetical protein GMST_18010 [Geomonas silvestris]|uniref:Uncharacterized protein n=1 Tax=Geomonas silvestris TaxID=2740184 RepID=A0A6V8MHL9_9BACT|nr:hypothetical protein [Geomonas silvestris]GFO59476.1 hypothetical protein GMST_18010 [Geomonas silvestris]